MGNRYEYETPGVFKNLFIALSDRLNGTKSPLEWIVEKKTGLRFALDETEREILSVLSTTLLSYHALPKPKFVTLTDHSFDTVAKALADRRTGDAVAYDTLIQWGQPEWAKWCDDTLSGNSRSH